MANEADNAMIVYGRNPVREALRGRRRVHRIWATPAAAEDSRLADAGPAGLETASDEEIERLCGSPEHQGACAEVDPYPYAEPDQLLEQEDALVVCLDQVKDPRNLGAVCRVVECAGGTGVVIPERRAAEVTPAACKTSAGAVEHLPVARVRNIADSLDQAKAAGAWIYGGDADAPVPYYKPDYMGRVVLVLGAEERGLRPRVLAACDELIGLPIRGRIDSLNVSTAAAALVYGALERRRLAGQDVAGRPSGT